MKKVFTALVLFVTVITYSPELFAQKEDDYMRVAGKGMMIYKGKSYSALSMKSSSIAQNCNCPESENLFRLARRQYLGIYLAFAVTMPVGVVGAWKYAELLAEQNSGNLEYNPFTPRLPQVLIAGVMIFPPYILYNKSIGNFNQAVREFNKCVDQNPKE
jgi:hypothetical protein